LLIAETNVRGFNLGSLVVRQVSKVIESLPIIEKLQKCILSDHKVPCRADFE
jgi:hypothetical protein